MFRPYQPHQEEAHKYWLNNKAAALIMEMRLGKTLVAVRGTNEMGDKKVLVNAPISAMDSWEKELRLEGISFVRAYALPRQQRIAAFKKALEYEFPMWILMNYEGYRNIPELASLPFDRVICDESTKIKNPQAQITKLILGGFKHVKKRAILTGLIAPEGMLNIFCQMKFIYGSFMGCTSFWDFRERYFEPDYDGFSWKPKKGKTDKIKETFHSIAFVKRRQDVSKNMPKTYVTRRVTMNAAQEKMYRQIEKEFAYECSQYGVETMWATVRHMWLQRVAGGFSPDLELLSTAKPDAIIDLYKQELKDQQVVIEYRFEKELDFDFEYFQQKGISCSMVKGPQSVESRRKHIKAFTEGKSKFLMCMEKWGDGQMGMDFSNASAMFYRSNELSTTLRSQTEERIYHPMKNSSSLYVDFICSDTVDEDSADRSFMKVFSAREVMTNFKARVGTIKDIFCTPESTPSLFDEFDPFVE